MQNPFLYTATGSQNHGWKSLRQVTANTQNTLVQPISIVIPDGGWTELISVSDCLEMAFMIESAVIGQIAPGSNLILIERSRSINATLSADINTYSSISPSTAWSVLDWSAGKFLGGFFRIKNQSLSSVSVFAQKRIN